MSDIAPIGRPSAASLSSTGRLMTPPSSTSAATRGDDKVELSAVAQLLGKLRDLPVIRQDLVDRVKAELKKDEDAYASDDKIDAANDRLNSTYVYYGTSGAYKKENQLSQDKNAESYSRENKVERAVSKSSHAYKNSSWDLVDASKDNEKVLSDVKEEDLPKDMKGMTIEQRKAYVKQKSEERKTIQLEIQSLNKNRLDYIASHTPQANKEAMLDAAMINAIKQQAKTKDLTWQ